MSTIKQKSTIVQIEGGKRIEVRRMRWRATRAMLRMLGKVVVDLYGDGKLKEIAQATGADSKLAAAGGMIPKLAAIVEQSDELLLHLATQSTDLTAEDFDELDTAVASEVIAQAFSVNFDAELKNSWASVVGVVRALMSSDKATTS